MDEDLQKLGWFYSNAIEESNPSTLIEPMIASALFYCPLDGKALQPENMDFTSANQFVCDTHGSFEIALDKGTLIVTTKAKNDGPPRP